jgi:hypothetical protein
MSGGSVNSDIGYSEGIEFELEDELGLLQGRDMNDGEGMVFLYNMDELWSEGVSFKFHCATTVRVF